MKLLCKAQKHSGKHGKWPMYQEINSMQIMLIIQMQYGNEVNQKLKYKHNLEKG